MKGKES